MAIVLVKTVSTDNGREEFFVRSTLHSNSYASNAQMHSKYLRDCKSYQEHREHGELYTVYSYLLEN